MACSSRQGQAVQPAHLIASGVEIVLLSTLVCISIVRKVRGTPEQAKQGG